ncbi:MAG: hypothetical protein KIS85_05685 [Anaerolineales bacterium]|nr:hypothetical protein [Anaerolineales bacterium]
MNRHNMFWGAALILVGAAFLASNMGLVSLQWPLLWPLFFILLGVYVLLSRSWQPSEQVSEFNIPLEGAKAGTLKMEHGAGKIRLAGGGNAADLISGRSAGLTHKAHREGDVLKVKISTAFGSPESFFPWNWGLGYRDWQLQLNPKVPTTLKVESGASESILDLRNTKVTELKVETGASSTTITMPERAGHTRARISGGAASFQIIIPDGVAARIEVESGLGSVKVAEERFPRSGGAYQSPDFAGAANKLDLRIEAGVSSITIE